MLTCPNPKTVACCGGEPKVKAGAGPAVSDGASNDGMDRFCVPNVGVAPTFGADVPNMPTAGEGLAGVDAPNTVAG